MRPKMMLPLNRELVQGKYSKNSKKKILGEWTPISQKFVLGDDLKSLLKPANITFKTIIVFSGERTSLQSHEKRTECRTVFQGTATVAIDNYKHFVTEGKSVPIPSKSKHRVENQEEWDLIFIEV